jgi:hypothetical protein
MQHQDGMNLVPLLKTGLFGERDLFWHYPHYGNQGGEPSSMIRRGPWKLIHYWEDGRQELYNIDDDIGEVADVAEQQPQIVVALNDGLQAWLKDVDATIPRLDARYDQAKYDASQKHVREVLKPRLERQHADMLHPDFNHDTSWWGSLQSED